jgi:hypothetical protein
MKMTSVKFWLMVVTIALCAIVVTVNSMSTMDVEAHRNRVSPRYRAIPPPNECTRTHTVDAETIIEANTCRRCCGNAFSRSVHARAPLTPLLAKHFNPQPFATTCLDENNNHLSMCCSMPGTGWECVAIKD